MRRVEIRRIWGTADRYALEFRRVGGDVWQAALPADLRDGQYAAVLHAVDEHGGEAMWSGTLYMHNGRASLVFEADGPDLRFLERAGIQMSFEPDGVKLTI